eukprot:Phypoly_transcript_11018.p3 GENE.Phypoly_transcript_11018~~Phypoly_transcript_11018.p3  ORF type:complete len:168 (+),score=29.61 Phypoly_transcript_11018:741-1244(+)
MYWVVALVGGLIAGYFISKYTSPSPPKTKTTGSKTTKGKSDAKNNKPLSNEEYKLVLVVRNDLNMGKGKIAAQCSHATLGAFVKAQKKDKAGLDKWEEDGQAKVVVKTQDEDEMMALEEAARKANLVTYIVVDAGRTQIASGTSTVLAVGPGPISKINSVTGALKLL